MDDSYNIDRSPEDSENTPVLSVEEMAILLVQPLVLWNQGTPFGKAPQSSKLSFKLMDKFVGLGHAVAGDECRDFIHVPCALAVSLTWNLMGMLELS